jgi:LysM repeat protein
MGFFDFIKDAGAKILGKGDDNENVKSYISKNSKTMPIENLDVVVDGETVTLKGHAMTTEDRVKAALIAGNIEGVTKVNFEGMTVAEEVPLNDLYYEIQKGDSLWKIADIYYKDGSRYPDIVAANLEVIKDADKIYPGQMIRIPNFVA